MISEQNWPDEQKKLASVLLKLKQKIDELEPEVSDVRHQAIDIRKKFWEEITVNTSSDEDFEESFLSIKQQEAILSERERSYRHMLRQWKSIKRLQLSPYFGRIDFQEDGLDYSEQVYIGVASFIDDDGLNFLIYDWRSPIASLYYDHSPGRASYKTPIGDINGSMELKRQYGISNGKLKYVFDTSLTIGDELLQQTLSKQASDGMQNIVATIQKEQNTIIRDDTSKMLIVQGVAGSGKTSAALQRVAYLLYKHREQLTADQIILFSPNPLFNSYVSTVLPELGEENMQQTTFQEYLEHWLGKDYILEDQFDQLEYVMTKHKDYRYSARLEGMKYKASPHFLQAMNNYSKWLCKQGMIFQSICFREQILISSDEIRQRFYSIKGDISLANRIAIVQEWLLQRLTVLEHAELQSEWVEDELNYLDNDHYAEAFRESHRERGVFDFAEQFEVIYERLNNKERHDEADFEFAGREEKLLRQAVVKRHFKPIRRSVKAKKFINLSALYIQLFHQDHNQYRDMTNSIELPSQWKGICQYTIEELNHQRLLYEDATPFLYLKEQVEGVQTSATVRHVFIDEAQDYSLFQYEFLKRLFPRARMTALGDFNQAIFTQATVLHGEQTPLINLYGEDDTRIITLMRSYRSTYDIVQFTKSLLPGGNGIIPFERRGERPLLRKVSERQKLIKALCNDISMLREQGFASIAVITKTAEEGNALYLDLEVEMGESIRLITKNTLIFERGVVVIPVYLAKGVEFDAVILPDASIQTYGKDADRKLFYTACTRAMHRLFLYASEAWTPFITNMDNVTIYTDEV